MTTRTLSNRARILVALGVTSLGLIAAVPANAIYREYEPGDGGDAPTMERTADSGNTGNGCSVVLYKPDGTPGQTIVYPEGYSFSVKNPATGKTHTFTCTNGTWVETVSATSPTGGYKFRADKAYVDAYSQDAVLVNAYEYTSQP